MSKLRAPIIAAAAVATLVAVVCSALLGIDGVSRIHVVVETGGSWGAIWESLARSPREYQQAALDAVTRTVLQLGVASELIAALALVLHAVSRLLEEWRALAIRCALGATLRHLLRLVGRDLAILGAIGCGIGFVAGAAVVAALAASWPSILSRPPLIAAAIAAATLSLLAVWTLLGLVAVTMLVILQRGVRTVSELHGAHITSGGPVMLLQSALAVLQLAGLLAVTYGCVLILQDSAISAAFAEVAQQDSVSVAPLQWSGVPPDARARAARYRQLFPTLRGATVASPDAGIGIGKEVPLLSICNDCRIGSFVLPMPTGRARVIAAGPGRRMLDGRDFNSGDSLGSRRVAVLNLAASLKLFPGTRTPIGKPVRAGFAAAAEYTVVGVAAFEAPPVFGNPPQLPVVFLSLLQHPPAAAEIAAPENMWDALRERLAALPADATAIGEPRPLGERIEDFTAPIRLFGAFFLGLAVSATGIAAYSQVAVMNQMIRMRERDIAIRMAVGAQIADIERWVVARTVWLTVWGVALGVSGARWIGFVLHGPKDSAEQDLAMLGAMILAFGLLGIVASWLPARRAARIEPAAVWAEPRA